MYNAIRVLLVDRHSLVRIGIGATLSVEKDMLVVGEATDVYQAQQLCKKLKPDVVLLELNTFDCTLPQAITDLREFCPEVKVLILTAFDDMHVGDLVAAGAVGCVLKDEETETLVRAIRTAAQGNTWFSQATIKKLVQWETDNPYQTLKSTLTQREKQLLSMIAKGWDNFRIAAELNLAQQTVRNYISRIYAKLAVSSRSEAMVWAMKNSLAEEARHLVGSRHKN